MKIQYNRNRYYDYYTGRWLTHDPWGTNPTGGKGNPFEPRRQYDDGISLYEYVSNNPVVMADPFGLTKTSKACRCGPDITKALMKLSIEIWGDWLSWSSLKRARKCVTMFDPFWGWDILELKRPMRVEDKQYVCPRGKMCDGSVSKFKGTKGTVTVSGKCYRQAAVNFWLWGRINKLCKRNLFKTVGDASLWKKGVYDHWPTKETTGWIIAGYFGNFSGVPSTQSVQCRTCPHIWPGTFRYRWGH